MNGSTVDNKHGIQNVCKYCQSSYYIADGLNNHEENCWAKEKEDVDNKCKSRVENTKNELTKEKCINICKTCGLQFKYKKVLQKHESLHNSDFPFRCKLCTQNFSTCGERYIHRLQDHPQTVMKKYKCKLCTNLAFNNEEEYLLHITDVHRGKDNDYFICSECGKQFKTKSELTQHSNSKCSTVKQYTCKVCNQELMTPGSLHNHMRRHSGELSCMCGYCGKQFVTLGQLKVHARIHTQDKVCGKGFCHRQSLITHSTLHTGIKPYQCENCSKSFSCVGNLLKHRRTHSDTCGMIPLTSHRVVNPTTKIKVKINTPNSSRLKTFNKQKEIEVKVAAYKKTLEFGHNSMQENICQNAKEGFTNTVQDVQEFNKLNCDNVLPDLQFHIAGENKCNIDTFYNDPDNSSAVKFELQKEKGEHRFEHIKKDLGTPYELKCRHCHKSYTNVRWLAKHEKIHLNVSNDKSDPCVYKCSCCKIGFNTKEECKMHQQAIHSDTLTCEDCDKIFSNIDSLRSHQNTFHKGLPRKIYTYICNKCGLQFRQKATLDHHEKSNCGEKPIYQCNVCGKEFTNVYTLKAHLNIHDPKKKFLCKFCGKSFRWKGQLKIHERSHTGEKPFKCLYCPKAFAYRESLLTHSSLHTGIKPHLCQACGSRFSCIGNLIKHRFTHASTCGTWYSKNQGI